MTRFWMVALAAMPFALPVAALADPVASCDRQCLSQIADAYRAAYLAHDLAKAPFAAKVRFSENGVELHFPDASWDTVTVEKGPALTSLDPKTGSIGIYTAVMQAETPGFLAIRLKVQHRQIVEVEHMMATRRYVSQPPVVFGDVDHLVHDPELLADLTPSQRRPRAEMIRIADGYFSTLERNDGTIHTRFASNCHRIENGREFAPNGCEPPFKQGYYAFNARVRDRDYVLVDEQRGLVMARAFIDHKGQMNAYRLTDGTEKTSPFREPQTWSVLEIFKIKDGAIGPIEADFIGVPYFTRSPWTGQRKR